MLMCSNGSEVLSSLFSTNFFLESPTFDLPLNRFRLITRPHTPSYGLPLFCQIIPDSQCQKSESQYCEAKIQNIIKHVGTVICVPIAAAMKPRQIVKASIGLTINLDKLLTGNVILSASSSRSTTTFTRNPVPPVINTLILTEFITRFSKHFN